MTAVSRTTSLQSFVTASGEIVADRYADIGSSTMGRLVELAVKEGDRVKAGQLLARIDPVQARSCADGAAAALRALEAEASAAAAEQVRARPTSPSPRPAPPTPKAPRAPASSAAQG